MRHVLNWHHRRGVGLAAALAITISGTAFGSLACGNLDSTSEQNAPSVTPTTAVLAGVPSIEHGRNATIARVPELGGFIAAVEAGDVDQSLTFFSWVSKACDNLVYQGVNECDRRHIAFGTVLELFTPEWWEGPGLTRAEARDEIAYDIQGRHPRLALVAERSDGPLVLLFLIDPKPTLVFPGGAPAGGSPTMAIWFATSKEATNRIQTFDYRMQGAPPLEFLRYEQHVGRFDFTILGVTSEFEGIEAAFHAENEKQRTIPPVP